MDADTLVRAIRAALDETERLANEALSHPTRWHGGVGERTGTDDGVWRAGSGMDECRVEGIGITIYDEGGHSAEQARHIAHNDPAAVLRRVAADRRVLERHQPVEVWIGPQHDRVLHKVECGTCRDGSCTDDYDMVCGTLDWPCPEIRDLCDRLGINPETETP